MSRAFCLLALTLACLALALPAVAERFVFSSLEVFPRSAPDGSGFEDRILAEAMRRLGHDFELVRIPSERALVSLDQGLIDGEYVRIAGLGTTYPSIVMVAEPIAKMEFVAITLSPSLPIDSWKDLEGLRLGVIRGWKIVEDKTRGFPKLQPMRDEAGLFDMLAYGRVDAIVYERLEGTRQLSKPGAPAGMRMGKTLEFRDMYLYLSGRRASLAAPLAAELRELRSEGFIDKVTDEVTAAAFK
ncbi:MAG: transporter substrate-binding domain-containing protein [Spirochaetaceae bacterium]|nr:transporter substrate-binding domain-containing protein [Spirochaetaceae bacterium]